MTTSFQKISGFDRPHESEMLSDSKISTLESGLNISDFACEFAVCVWTIAVSGKKKLQIQKYPHTCGRGLRRDKGRFPFDQKFGKFRVGELMEQTFSGISFRNFGSTSRGWPKIPENRNNRKIPLHSTIPARA